METRNRSMRTGAVLMILALITACFAGGTLAKYTSGGSGTDSARVAKWGVDINGASEAFSAQYSNTDRAVTVKAEEKVVAPGTKGSLAEFKVTGASEVSGEVTYEVTGITISDNWTASGESYFPIVFKVNGQKVEASVTGTDTTALVRAMNEKLSTVKTEFTPGKSISADSAMNITWEWPFAGDDAKDTELGSKAADGTAPTVSIAVKAAAVQVD